MLSPEDAMPTRLTVVFLPDFSHELLDAAQRRHVWLIETPANLRAAESCQMLTEPTRDRGVTTFQCLGARSARFKALTELTEAEGDLNG
jgi:hypothetical protein